MNHASVVCSFNDPINIICEMKECVFTFGFYITNTILMYLYILQYPYLSPSIHIF